MTPSSSLTISPEAAVAVIASQIIGNAKLVMDAEIAVSDRLITNVPKMLGVASYENSSAKKKF